MGYPTKVQLIKRKKSEQWYINFPSAVAQAMEFARGEVVEWLIEDKAHLLLKRTAHSQQLKKKQVDSSKNSINSSKRAEEPLPKKDSSGEDAASQ